MNPISVALLASVFKLGGAAVGLPSMTVLVLYAVHTVKQRFATPTPETNFGDNPDGVLLVLKGMSQVIGTTASFIGALAQIVFDMAAFAAGAGLLVAVACWFTGRGLQADAISARVSASVMLTVGVLLALVFVLSLRGAGRLLPLALAVLGAFALHALWFGARPVAS
jgi:hypothetical protein